MSKILKAIMWADRSLSHWKIEIGLAAVLSALFCGATKTGCAYNAVGCIALALFWGMVLLNQLSRFHWKNKIRVLRQELKKQVETLELQQAEIAKASEHLARSKDKLLGMSDLKNKFISMVSHELRTPVTAIQECLNLIAEEVLGPVVPKQKEFLEVALRNVQRLTLVMNHLLDMSHLEAGGMNVSLVKASLDQMIMEAINAVRPKAQKKNIELIMEAKCSLPPALVDRQRVMQVLKELLDNAVKFTELTGKAGISVRLPEDSGQMEICVWDTGCGMSEEEVEQVFGRYFQVHKKGDYTAVPGAGLGLVLSKEIITQLGGSIWVESHPGQGSRFYFTLQCYSDEALLRTCFQGAVREAQLRNSMMICLGLHVQEYEELRKKHSNHAIDCVLSDLHAIVTSYFRAEDRVAVDYAQGKIHVLMVATDRDMAARIRKLDDQLRGQTFIAGDIPVSLVFKYGLARFPEHGESLHALRDEIERQIRSGGLEIGTLPMEGAA